MAKEQRFKGLGVSLGIAIGTAYVRESGVIDVPEYRVTKKQVAAEQGRLKEAIAQLKVAVAKDPQLNPALNLLGKAYRRRQEPGRAREMFERGDWVTTTLAGEPWYDKPILYYWTALVGYHLIGIGELAARLGPALAGLLTVLLTFLLGRRFLASYCIFVRLNRLFVWCRSPAPSATPLPCRSRDSAAIWTT